jgi:hypothetical protein
MTPAAEPSKSHLPEESKKRSADWLKTCLGDWDTQTHMSKAEWRTTRQRVSTERERFFLNTPGATSIGETKSR